VFESRGGFAPPLSSMSASRAQTADYLLGWGHSCTGQGQPLTRSNQLMRSHPGLPVSIH